MPSAYEKMILATPGLVHYFRMSGGATDADLGPGGATLTHNGGPISTSGLIRDPNGAKRYSGTTMDSTFSTSAFSGATAMSMEFWFRETALVDWAHLFANDDHPTCRFMIIRNANTGVLSTGWRDGVGGADYGGPTAAYRQLDRNYVMFSADGTNLRLVLNGVLTNTWPMAGAFGTGARTFRVSQQGSQPLTGDMDEVAMYNLALPIATSQRHYKAGLASGVLNGLLLPV